MHCVNATRVAYGIVSRSLGTLVSESLEGSNQSQFMLF